MSSAKMNWTEYIIEFLRKRTGKPYKTRQYCPLTTNILRARRMTEDQAASQATYFDKTGIAVRIIKVAVNEEPYP